MEGNMNQATTTRIATECTFIPMKAVPDKAKTLAELLKAGAETVRKTEPQTLQWLALQEDPIRFTIADFFPDAKGREAHFSGRIAEALKRLAPDAVEGGWEQGVVANGELSKVLSAAISDSNYSMAKLALRIDIRSRPGKAAALAKLLTGAAEIIEATEPETLLWYALQIEPDRFAIFDVFPSEIAKQAHFSGKVAASLKAKAEELIQGGWDKGVTENIRSYQILSCTY
jgi:quinol monooxygenase YgiN